MPLEPGTLLINRYRVIETLGQGGMGSVYRATDENLGVCVAVKENLFLSDEYARQFRLEANILAGLRHPSLPRVGDHFVIDRQGQYLVMDYIEGDDLRQIMDQTGPLSDLDVIRMGIAVCDALSYLHTRIPPIVHRDIKPGNIKMAPDGQVVLVDFGLAKIMMGEENTTTGARAMTPGYSPPEQYGTAHTDPRSDIYSLGATLYVALTNIVPEDGLARVTGNAVLTNPRKLNPSMNRKLSTAIIKAMAVDPDSRYQTADDFKLALQEAEKDLQSGPSKPLISRNDNGDSKENSRADSTPVRGFFPAIRSKVLPIRYWLMAGVSILLLLIGAAFVWSRSEGPKVFGFAFASTPTASPVPTKIHPQITSTLRPRPSQTIAPVILLSPTLASTPTPLILSPTPSSIPEITIQHNVQIAYVSERSGNPQLWIMNSDGTNQRQLTTLKDGACEPDWSPDGQRLVFISPCPSMISGRFIKFPGSSLHVINADGSGMTALPLAPEGDYDPAWSPDGKEIAFTSLKDGHPQIYILNLVTNIRQPLSINSYDEKQPAWSPDGRTIAFVRLYGTNQIWIMSADGSNQRQVTRDDQYNNLWPSWTPDGQIIFFGQTNLDAVVPWLMATRLEDLGTYKVFKVPALKQLDFEYISQVRVSQDNHWIAFEGWSGPDSHNIWIMTIGGAERQNLTNSTDLNYSPVWRPVLTQP